MEKIIKIPVIAISGGPAGGKSSFLNQKLVSKLKKKGFTPFLISEAASLVASFGVNLGNLAAQKAILQIIIAHEDAVITYVKEIGVKKPVIITDRSALDAMAYCTEEEFKNVCREMGTTIDELRRRYSAVIHLKSLAVDKPKTYEKVKNSNPHRTEDASAASALDSRTISANLGVKQIWSVDNRTNVKKKLEIAFELVMHVLGYPIPREIERKFLVDLDFTPEDIPVKNFKIEINQDYLVNKVGKNERVRKEKFPDKAFTFTNTIKTKANGSAKYAKDEDENQIPKNLYRDLLKNKNERKATVKKHRYKFLYLDQYFELDFFYDNTVGKYLVMLEIELAKKFQRVKFPPWLPIIKEVTTLDKFGNSKIAESIKERIFEFY